MNRTSIVAEAATLTAPESSRLEELETVIDRGRETFIAVGQALAEIREGRLYRATHSTFEAYCQERHGWTRQHTNRVIAASTVARQLEPMGSTSLSERAIRPLTKLPPAERSKVIATIKAKTGTKPVTSTVVKAAVAEVTPKVQAGTEDRAGQIAQHVDALVDAAEVLALSARLPGAERVPAVAHAAGELLDVAEKILAIQGRPSLGGLDARNRLLGSIKVALIAYSNDDKATPRGKPYPAQRRRDVREIELLLDAFKHGELRAAAHTAPDPEHLPDGREVVERDAHGPVIVRRPAVTS